MKPGIVLLLAALALSGGPAQAAREAPAEAAGACELHLWPAAEIQGFAGGSPGIMGGGLLGGLIDVAMSRSEDRAPPAPDVLSPREQLDALALLNLPRLLGLGPGIIVPHDEPLPRQLATAVRERHGVSDSGCYAELIVSQLFIDHAPMAGREFRSLIVYRTFDASPVVASSFATWTATSLARSPIKRPKQPEAEQAEIRAAFDANVRQFAFYANPANRKTRSRKQGR
ncbi:MAG: hypothetical protein WDN24_12890 [Sphingomonas sp.]